jgi:hypothetical protein
MRDAGHDVSSACSSVHELKSYIFNFQFKMLQCKVIDGIYGQYEEVKLSQYCICLFRGSNFVQSVVSHFTDWAVPAPTVRKLIIISFIFCCKLKPFSAKEWKQISSNMTMSSGMFAIWSLMMEAVNVSETSVALYETTLRNFQKTYLRQTLLCCL